jgi:altronate dehydratase
VTQTTTRALRLSALDDVAVMIEPAVPGDDVLGVIARDAVPFGHKMALHDVAPGSVVRKYGQPIGIATRPILAGEHVHSHNLAVGQGRHAGGAVTAGAAARGVAAPVDATFQGYLRANGQVGTRNCIAVMGSVNCAATVVRRIARKFEDAAIPGIDAVVPLTHASGCGMAKSGEGIDTLERTLVGYARNPNFAGAVIIGLGCEVAQIGEMLERHGLAAGPLLKTYTIQDAGGTASAIEKGVALVQELIEEISTARRTVRPASDLVLGLQCGGSDGWSGVTANPALGAATDLLVAAGGRPSSPKRRRFMGRSICCWPARPILPWLLLWRSGSGGGRLMPCVTGSASTTIPPPGTRRGLTTIFEKSLGAVAKAGSAALSEVLLYGQPRSRNGLIFMDSPGYDPCSATGQIASGANLLAFTTGRGSVFGAQCVPCLKLASNAQLAMRMGEDIDIDCSPILSGMSVEELGKGSSASCSTWRLENRRRARRRAWAIMNSCRGNWGRGFKELILPLCPGAGTVAAWMRGQPAANARLCAIATGTTPM